MAAARDIAKKDSNILWLTDNIDTLAGFQEIYARIIYLETSAKVPWILLNVACEGSEDSDFSAAILNMLQNCKKPIKTQVMTNAHSYGLLFACVGEDRVGWSNSGYMHHSFHTDIEHTSIEDVEVILKNLKKEERKCLAYMKEQMGQVGFNKMIRDFKKNSHKDMYFDVEKAVQYNIVNRVGSIEPIFF